MALDHYISQVHLKNFYSSELGDAFYCIRKGELKLFHQCSAAVCRIEENSTNFYLKEDRIVEEFLKGIEPKYNASVARLISGEIDPETIYTLAGFITYIITCSPAGMRIQSNSLKGAVEETTKVIEKAEDFPAPPESLGGESLSELIEKGKVKVKIDPKYPQAIGISNILSTVKIFGNSKWEVLLNSFDDSPFFTSDFPVVIETSADLRVLNRIIPLTPSLAIRICPDLELEREKLNFEFSEFQFTTKELSRKDVSIINKDIVRCAESVVFFSKTLPWVEKFVKKHSKYRIEPKTVKIQHGKRKVLWSTQKISQLK